MPHRENYHFWIGVEFKYHIRSFLQVLLAEELEQIR
jgi:hypothetical protein